MAGGIRVTPEQLRALGAGVSRGAGQIEGINGTLRSQVAPVVGGDWAGQASTQFQQLWEQWQRNAKGLNDALHGISRLLDASGSIYAMTEQDIARTFRP